MLSKASANTKRSIAATHRRGAILLEVVIALALFAMGSTFVMSVLHSAIRGANTAKLDAQASDLLVTVISEVHMGVIEKVDAGPSPFDAPELEGWTWQVSFTGMEDRLDMPQLKRMVVSVRNEQQEGQHEMTQLIFDSPYAQKVLPVQDIQNQIPAEVPADLPAGALNGLGGLP
ncbi:MAG: hypothetical protein WD768_21820 [Phycisphaeraceae bacterium]